MLSRGKLSKVEYRADHINLQGGHAHHIPEVLLLDEVDTIEVPRLRRGIPNVIGNRERPCASLYINN